MTELSVLLISQVVLISPTEIAKVRMQTQKQPHYSVTASHLSKPKYQGSVHCLRTIAKEEGFKSLYKGCSALLCRDCHSFATYFLTYSVLCDWLTPAGKNKPGMWRKQFWIARKNGLVCIALRGKAYSEYTFFFT